MTSLAEHAHTAVTTYGALQDESELTAMLSVVDSVVKPEYAVEIGTYHGATTYALACIPTVRRVITVDLRDEIKYATQISEHADLITIVGDSRSGYTYDKVASYVPQGHPCFVFIDGAHDYDSCRCDTALYEQLAIPDGAIAWHDTQGHPNGPDFAVGEIVDAYRGRYLVADLVAQPGVMFGTAVAFPALPGGSG